MPSKTRIQKMAETRAKLIKAGREAFAEKGYAAASMDDLTGNVGLTRGALYHNFGDKRGLMEAIVDEIDMEVATKAKGAAELVGGGWQGLMAEGAAYIEAALEKEFQRIVLLDGPAVLGDPAHWPSQNRCLQATIETLTDLSEQGLTKQVDIEGIARLLNGVALNAALWVAASDDASSTLPKAIHAFECLASGVLSDEVAPKS